MLMMIIVQKNVWLKEFESLYPVISRVESLKLFLVKTYFDVSRSIVLSVSYAVSIFKTKLWKVQIVCQL